MEELSEKKIKALEKQPLIESTTRKSENGKWIIHKVIITDIKPITYVEKVLKGSEAKDE